MATYGEMLSKVRDWSDRDDVILSNAVIGDFLDYAVDEAYRTLRVVPLEYTVSYSAVTKTEEDSEANKLSVPTDLIEFIQLRRVDNNNRNNYDIYEAKMDTRAFYNDAYTRTYGRFYTREGNNIIAYPAFQEGDTFELYYYRRLADVDARYEVDSENHAADNLWMAASETALTTLIEGSSGENASLESLALSTSDYIEVDTDNNGVDSDYEGLAVGFYLGKLTPNWLRDQNEKILLYGALYQAYLYMDEQDSAERYYMLFEKEIQKLNTEDKMRMVHGGTVTRRFNGRLI